MAQQLELFANDPTLRMRDCKGRFATPEKAMYDRAIMENKSLSLQVEKFKRAWLSAGEMSSIYHRKYLQALEEIKELRQKIALL